MNKKRISAKLYDNKGGPDAFVAPPPILPTEVSAVAPSITRDAQGRFLPGSVANPKGAEKGRQQYLTGLRRNMEICMRDYLATPVHAQMAFEAIDRLFDICIRGEEKNAVGALKLLLDKLMTTPRQEEVEHTGPTLVKVEIVNKTSNDQPAVETIDINPSDYEEIPSG